MLLRYITNLLREILHKFVITPKRELLIDQSIDTTKVQLGESIYFIGVIFRNLNGGLFIETEMTQRHHRAYNSTGDSSDIFENWNTLNSLQAVQQVRVYFFQDSGLKCPSRSLAGLCFFQASGLVSVILAVCLV